MNNPNYYFEYKGEKYGIGTIYVWKSLKRIQYFTFAGITKEGDYLFIPDKPGTCVTMNPRTIDDYNLEFIKSPPIESYKPIKQGKSYIDYSVGWMWYIVAMLTSLLFKDFLTAWVGITITFIVWRKKKRGEI